MFAFLGIGAQKAGTTWLYSMLRQHPEIGFPLGKEAHFWNKPHDRRQIDRYLGEFCRDDRKEGEITPAYALLPPSVIETIDRCNPDLRLIYIIRNPLERSWSSALMALRRAEMEIDEASDQWFIDHFRSQGSLRRGNYAQCLQQWCQVVRQEQLLVLRFEQIKADPARLLNACFGHLGVRAIKAERLQQWGCDRPVFTGSGHPIPPALKRVLMELYRSKVEALSAFLGEDFGGWLS